MSLKGVSFIKANQVVSKIVNNNLVVGNLFLIIWWYVDLKSLGNIHHHVSCILLFFPKTVLKTLNDTIF